MIPFSLTTPMTAAEIVAATHALLQVARVDAACTQQEIELIRSFYHSNGTDEGLPAFDTLLGQPAGPTGYGALTDPEHRDFVVAACAMVAYADGQLSEAETRSIRDVGLALGVSEARVSEILALVQDHLLAQLAGLPDSASVAKVAQELS